MKNDITTDCCRHQHNPANEHCCHDKGCVTTHFFQQAPDSGKILLQPNVSWLPLFAFEPDMKLLPDVQGNKLKKPDRTYSESLYCTFIQSAWGLRAPPCVLA
jgi:hypothetical protein